MTTILIIDSDIALLARLDSLLAEAGYQVVKTSEIAPARHLISEMQPALVLLEVKTGRGDGWELLGDCAAQVPIIVLSTEGREENVVRGFELGAIDYIAKPYRSAELVARVQARLRTSATPVPVLRAEPAPRFVDDLGEYSTPPLTDPGTPAPLPYNDAPPTRSTFTAAPADTNGAPTSHPAPAPEPPIARRKQPADEQVFMSDHEELALLRASNTEDPAPAAVVPPDASLGRRLWAERQRRRITLVQAENDLHIRMWYLQAMEEEHFTLLPRGQFAIQMLRSYAQYLDMNPNEIVAEYQAHFASTQQPTPPLAFQPRRRLRLSVPRWLIYAVAVMLALAVSLTVIYLFDPDMFSRTLVLVQEWLPLEQVPWLNPPTPGDLVPSPTGSR